MPLGIGEIIYAGSIQVIGGFEVRVEAEVPDGSSGEGRNIKETGYFIFMISYLQVFVVVEKLTPVFPVVTLAQRTAVYACGIGEFLRVKHIVGRKAGTELEIEI